MTPTTPATLYQKLVASHTVAVLDEQNVLLFCDLHLMNEYTSPQAFAGLHEAGHGVPVPGQNVAVVSHIIPTHPVRHRVIQDPPSALQASNLKANCDRHGIPLFDTNDPLQGIEHVVAPEHGMVRPGMVIICGDSHTTTYGALGAFGFGIGTSQIEHLLASQTLVYKRLQSMRVRVDGKLRAGVVSKDIIMALIARIGASGATGYAVEFCGEAIDALSVEARMTVCNMAVEAGARGAFMAPDQKVFDYLANRPMAPKGERWQQALSYWRQLQSDPGAQFDREVHIDASQLQPMVTWGTSPDQALAIDGRIPAPSEQADPILRQDMQRALDYMGLQAGQALQGIRIDHAFIGSCTNARIEDLRQVAEVIGRRQVASHVRAMIVPGSTAVREQAEAEGLARQFIEAGFEWRQSGCSMCLAMNDDVLPAGARCASSTNRNFEGRQGAGARTHLMSPAMVAAAAIAGHLTDIRSL